MAEEVYIPIQTNGGSQTQTPNMKLKDSLGAFINDRLNIVSITGDGEAESGQRIRATVVGTSSTISLPEHESGISKEVWVKKVDAPVKDIIVDCVDGKKINGLSTKTLPTQYDSACFTQDPVTGDWDIW